MIILGISAFYHDSAAALIKEGKIIAAAQEERFNRQKNFSGFPRQAISYCLSEAGITLSDVDQIVFYEKPLIRFERLLETYLAYAPKGFSSFIRSMPIWLKEKLFQKRLLLNSLKEIDPSFTEDQKLLFTEHHLAHAASAFYPSLFDRALILVMDGVGEWSSTSVMIGEGNTIQPLKEIHFPHSLGLLYSAFTAYCGFKINDGEYKLMGLAPYGKPRYVQTIKEHLITIAADGSFQLNMAYFNYCTGLTMTNDKFNQLFGRTPRLATDPIDQLHMDLASSIQAVTEEIILLLCQSLQHEYQVENLCLAGGVALNCVVNGKLQKSGLYKNIWIQPAAGDAGGALGAALAIHYLYNEASRQIDPLEDQMQGCLLGPAYDDETILRILQESKLDFTQLGEHALTDQAAQSLADGKVIGWFQGRMEYGPRALGARSILGDPRQPGMQSLINQKIKFRESFRPFAPAVLQEDLQDYFDLDTTSPYMLLVAPVNKRLLRNLSEDEKSRDGLEQQRVIRSSIPAVTHIDNSARIQSVRERDNPRYYQLIRQFKRLTGCSVVVNTSFNVMDEPIVCTPQDAIHCFNSSGLDELFIGSFHVCKKEENQESL